ncbi:tripartite motif-containing protein 2-like [Lingula anatina]|uniref:Tripartite motif-containing protein 2-like n=1 Tax=Lingula anatina TaxID=7574 RepID=A0A1S3H7G2_LINAN|nr:tripartite motif-containing protein 2-like [Lingula anatina]|eukprot:XP_013381059.1 tripartite motif-containing protein 2-like [Lingula anatina]
MAEALAADIKENILTCSICLGEYEDPRVLPCYHTFCYGCISDHATHSQNPNRTFLCPSCREEISFPAGGLNQLKKNFVLSKTKDIITKQQVGQTLEEEQTKVAAVTQAIEQMTICCKKHPKNEFKYCCEDDNTVICEKCLAKEHGGHRISSVKQVTMEKTPVPTPDTPAKISYSPGKIPAAGREAMLGQVTVQSQSPLAGQGTNPTSAPHPVFLEKVKCVYSFSSKLKDDTRIIIMGLAADGTHVFALDFSSGRTKKFTNAGDFMHVFAVYKPYDLALSQTGRLYISSHGSVDKCVQVYSTAGEYLTSMGCGVLQKPWGVTLNRQGHVMVCDGGKKSIFTFHADSGELLNTIPLSMCKIPAYITVNSVNDNIVISDMDWDKPCVHVLSPTGDQLYQYGGTQGSGDGQLKIPQGVCTDSYGHIFIADTANHRIVALSSQGQFIRYIATKDDGLKLPVALAINPAGQLVVAEQWGTVKTFQYLQ